MRFPKTIDKLILKSYLGPMAASFFIVWFVLMMNFVWKYIDEMVGKGLSTGVVVELMLYASLNMIALGFPLAVLFAAIMTMGNLGENYELLALKSAGISLPRILAGLFVVTSMFAVASFFVTNNLTPYTNRKMSAMIWDIREQKQQIEFKDGQFFNGIENLSIRVERQDPKTGLLRGILIYNAAPTGRRGGNMQVTVADSGYIRLTDDKRFLETTFFGGEMYDMTRDRNWYDKSVLNETTYTLQHSYDLTPGYDFARTDESLFGNNATTKNVVQLQADIDSLGRDVTVASTRTYRPLLNDYLFQRDTMVISSGPAARRDLAARRPDVLLDSINNMKAEEKARVYGIAERIARSSREVSFDEAITKEALNNLYRSQIEWHKKWSLPVAVIVFFLIGAPLGAIIRKGGLGMPIVISVAFFVLYYVISIMCEKLAKEGTWPAFWGVWTPTLVLLPIALYLVYKATNDSGLLNVEWYIIKYQRWKKYFTGSRRR